LGRLGWMSGGSVPPLILPVRRTWGDVPYPVQYGYDEYGRRTDMRTFRQELGWSSPTWPEGAVEIGRAGTTRRRRGCSRARKMRLASRSCTRYGVAARLATRTWARQKPGGGPLRTTHGYEPNTGELVRVE
jgi:hypothetical protein